jgi:hypothetical protein
MTRHRMRPTNQTVAPWTVWVDPAGVRLVRGRFVGHVQHVAAEPGTHSTDREGCLRWHVQATDRDAAERQATGRTYSWIEQRSRT